ncbi:MAG: hypothetical protein AAF585_02175 [Verrucomicrobiota bacterium]
MTAMLFRVILLALVAYLIVRLLRSPSSRAPQRATATPRGRAPEQDSIYSGEVLLTGNLRVQVVSSRDGKPLSGRRVSFRSAGFT